MTRLKFLIFAALVVALWVVQLFLLSPALSARAVELGAGQARLAPLAVRTHVLERRAELERLLLRVASTPQAAAVVAAARNGSVPPERLFALKDTARSAAPDSLRGDLLVGVVTDAATLVSRGEGEPETLAVARSNFTQSGAEGVPFSYAGQTYVAYVASAPDKSADILVAAKAIPDGTLATSAKLSGATLAVVSSSKVVGSAGTDTSLVEAAAKQLASGKVAVVGRGAVADLAGIKLPVLAGSDDAAPGSPLFIGAREPLSGTGLDVVAVVGIHGYLGALASFQKVALLALLGLLLLSGVWAVLLGSEGSEAAPRRVAPSPPALPPRHASSVPSMASPVALAEPPPVPEASPDDFQFGTPSPPAAHSSDNDATRGYPVRSSPPPVNEVPEYNYDATRVQAIPEELLRASAEHNSGSYATRAPTPAVRTWVEPPPAVAAPQPSGEEQHFHDIYREFVATRERCGEPADGLTYDKFVVKLKKNKEQLIQKYSCRTVRFQVYVKEGKAALKATPVRE